VNRRPLTTEEIAAAVLALVVVFVAGPAPGFRFLTCLDAQGVSNAPAVPAASAERPPIMGAWKLNHELSTRPQTGQMPDRGSPGERDRGAGGREPGSGGMGGMGGGRRGGMGGRSGDYGGGRPDEAQMRQSRELVQEVMTAPESFAITGKPGVVTFTDPDGRVRHYATDGKTEKHQLDTGVVDVKTRWNGGDLVMEIGLSQGMTLVQKYAVDPATHQLAVTLQEGKSRGQGSMPPVRWVYDNVGADR
jgi:hypothetical protein